MRWLTVPGKPKKLSPRASPTESPAKDRCMYSEEFIVIPYVLNKITEGLKI
jgi:hypothetical protein